MAAGSGAVTGGVRWLLRAEGLAFFAVGTGLFGLTALGWGWYFGLFLLPDVAFLAFLAGPRVGALVYNGMHSLIGPLALLAVGAATEGAMLVPALWLTGAGAIWLAHVGIDRALGYGLKYATGFRDTHLGRLGRPSQGEPG